MRAKWGGRVFDWDWAFAFEILPRLIEGLGNTLLAALIGYSIAVVLGLVLALVQRIPIALLRILVRECVEFIRSTPLILQIFFVFYVGPQIGVVLSPWTAGMIAIGVHYAAYLSEVYRGGFDSVPKGQWEAAKALNFSVGRTYLRIILPQALPACIAGLGNYLIGIFKDTPMLAVIGVAEMMNIANVIGAQNYRYLEPYTLVGILFLLVSLPAAVVVRVFERRIRKSLGLSA